MEDTQGTKAAVSVDAENIVKITGSDQDEFDIYPPDYVSIGKSIGMLPDVPDGDIKVGTTGDNRVVVTAADSGALFLLRFTPEKALAMGEAIVSAARDAATAALYSTSAKEVG